MIKTNIKMRVTPEQSAKVQQICFNNGMSWAASGQRVLSGIKGITLIDSTMYTTYTEYFIDPLFKEVSAELFIATNGSCEIANPLETLDADLMESTHTESHSIPTTDQFAKYGFQTPDFQCKLYDKLDDYILGAYFNPNKQKWTMCRWGFDGRNKQGSPNYALTPVLVHKPWYETCKFPCIIMADDCMPVVVKHYNDGYVYDFRDNKYCVKSWTPITDAELEALKRGF